MGTLIALLIFLCMVLIAVYVVDIVVASLGLPPRIVQLIKVIIGLLALLWLVQQFAHPWGGWYFR